MIYRKNEYLDSPHGNSTVWRYMNTWKLEQLLMDSSLFFPNANRLSDEHEISVPKSAEKKRRTELIASGLSGRHLEEEMASFFWTTNPMKDLVLVNCWSISQHESYALWKIYLGGEHNGIAVKTTTNKLKKSIMLGNDPYPEEFFLGKVKYKRYLTQDQLSRLSIITTKKPFYDFEKELRLFILNYPLSEGGTKPPYDLSKGRNVKVDLNTLIQEIYISPFADESYIKEIKGLLKKHKLKATLIKESEILDQ